MKFLKHISLYTFVGFLGAGVNFFIMPVLSHYLTPDDYGLLSLFNSYVTILLPIVSIAINGYLSVEFFKSKDRAEFAEKFTSVQLWPALITGILLLLTVLFYHQISGLIEFSELPLLWGIVTLAITYLTVYQELFFNFLVIEKKPLQFSVFTILKIGVEVSLTLYFIIGRGMDWEGRIYSWLITSVLFFILGWVFFYRQGYVNRSVETRYIKRSIAFGAPLILHNIGKFVINQSDRLFIIKMISMDEAGIYSVGYTVGSMILILITAFFNFYTPFQMELLARLDQEKKYQIVRTSYAFAVGLAGILLIMALGTPLFFEYFISPKYETAVPYVFWVGLGYLFWGGYLLFSNFIFFYERTRFLGWLSFFNVITNLLLNYLFIGYFGAIGAAYATALSFFFVFLITAYMANRICPLPWLEFSVLFTGIKKKRFF